MGFPTEAEFEYQRRAILAAYPLLFEAVEAQLRYVDEQIERGMLPNEPALFDLALMAHLARGTKTALGVQRLCENGFGELAIASLRGLGETMVSAYWMSLDPQPRAQQFENFAQLEAIDTVRFVDDMGWAVEVEVPEELRHEGWVNEVREQFPSHVQGWMQQPMNRVLADIIPLWGGEAAQQELRQVAGFLHLFGDRHSHVGTADTARFLAVPDEGGLILRMGPGKRWVPQALVTTAWVYGQLFDLAAEHFGIEDLEHWRRRWRLLLARCKSLNRDQARGIGRNEPCPCGSGFKFKRCHLELISDPVPDA